MPEDSGKFADKIGAYAADGGTVHINNLTVNASDSSEVISFTLADWREVCCEIIAERRKLTTNPLTSTEGVTLQVDDVYVPLGLVERKKPTKHKDKDDISPEQGSELYKQTEITRTFEHRTFLEEVIKQKNTPESKDRRIAIIGEPGAGKTTLLQQIADWVYREIPQSVVIWVSLADLHGQKLEDDYLLKTWLNAAVRKKGKAKPTQRQEDDFVALFNQKNVWLLLDGLDEMSASNPLAEIKGQLDNSGLISQARIVLTCRINLWDDSIHELNNFDIYRTLDFSYPQQVEEFINKWFNKIKIPETGKQLCTALKETGKERIRDLVKNPLRLTLLCLNWQSGDGKLPDTQAGLYQQFVDDFYKWKKEEFALNSHQRQQLNIKLGELAKTAIDKEATRFRLRQDFVSQFLGDAEEENSLFKLSLNRGWLNCVGVDINRKPVYAFFHASFQEYFAATAIDDWDFFLNHVPRNPRKGIYRIFEPQWKQVILLWLGRENVTKEKKELFIKALVEFDDKCGNFYWFRAYFIAASGISEFKECLRTDEIVNKIVTWDINNSLVKEEASVSIQETPRTQTINVLVNQLLKLVADLANKPENIRWYYVNQLSYPISSLEKIGVGNETAINALLKLLESKDVTKNDSCLHKVNMALRQICTIEENNINALLNCLESQGQDRANLTQLIQKLRIKGRSEQQVVYILVGMIEPDDMYEYKVYESEERLKKEQNKPVFDDLVKISNLQLVSYKTLAEAGYKLIINEPSNQIVIDALIELLELNIDEDIRRIAAFSLGKVELGNQKAIDALVRQLQLMDADEGTLYEVVDSLGCIGKKNKKAIEELVKLLDSTKDEYGFGFVAESLGKIDPGNKKAINSLENLLNLEDIDDNKLRLAAEGLGKIDPSNEKAVETLIKLLDSGSEQNGIYWLVPNSLKQILQPNQLTTVVTKLTSYLNSSQSWNYHYYQDVLWHCAKNMPYPDFYQAWHQHNFATRTMRSLKQILYTRII